MVGGVSEAASRERETVGAPKHPPQFICANLRQNDARIDHFETNNLFLRSSLHSEVLN